MLKKLTKVVNNFSNEVNAKILTAVTIVLYYVSSTFFSPNVNPGTGKIFLLLFLCGQNFGESQVMSYEDLEPRERESEMGIPELTN
jgi:hypothetical protein